jgi:hypothetical protein
MMPGRTANYNEAGVIISVVQNSSLVKDEDEAQRRSSETKLRNEAQKLRKVCPIVEAKRGARSRNGGLGKHTWLMGVIFMTVLAIAVFPLNATFREVNTFLLSLKPLEADASQGGLAPAAPAPAAVASNDQQQASKHGEPIVYFVLTGSLNASPKRCSQYARGIQSLFNETVRLNKRHRFIFVEGNGQRKTCLDALGIPVLYTDTNSRQMPNKDKGIKELTDVMASVEHLRMRDSDFLVKMTGRYYLHPGSLFMRTLNDIDLNQTHGIVKFGPYTRPSDKRMDDCITGLIMLPVSSVPVIWNLTTTPPYGPVEWDWAAAALLLPEDRITAVQGKMGIHITPGTDDSYFLV